MTYLIQSRDISSAWLEATRYILAERASECNNLLVEIEDPLNATSSIQDAYCAFCESMEIKRFSVPAATIFPRNAYIRTRQDRPRLYETYERRLHDILKGRWGCYFGQMINWNSGDSISINQIENIINRINSRTRIHKAAYTIQITDPHKHSGYVRGGPCLQYILLQLSNERVMDMLAVYRSHDFAVKAYGNYVGLGHLLEFICNETNFTVGKLACISSHAYIDSQYRSGLRVLCGGNND
ncbi:MAG: hypothetical protein K0R93_679 [Anaerosolibacter sp.]|jgi:thymidylate synthase|uniref:hypothetical protein n=1 Tax=Anaerosolibacter sp. TaxID=1872527 RepID=UPI00262D1A4D|nr:hypothetical protein [Anaerosolibacter sp.]MDF2545781.1 hypothetical protein [Anaerosolibacter sp.]